jgi:hypothetical protein
LKTKLLDSAVEVEDEEEEENQERLAVFVRLLSAEALDSEASTRKLQQAKQEGSASFELGLFPLSLLFFPLHPSSASNCCTVPLKSLLAPSLTPQANSPPSPSSSSSSSSTPLPHLPSPLSPRPHPPKPCRASQKGPARCAVLSRLSAAHLALRTGSTCSFVRGSIRSWCVTSSPPPFRCHAYLSFPSADMVRPQARLRKKRHPFSLPASIA